MDAQWQTLIQTKTTNAGMMKKKTDVAESKIHKYKRLCFFCLFFSVMMCFVVDVVVNVLLL